MELQRQPLSAIESGWAFEWSDAATATYGVRYRVVEAECVVAEAVVQHVPDQTLSILFTTPLADCPAEAIGLLLSAASETVQHLRLRYGYLLLSLQPPAWVPQCLNDAGFRAVERVVEFHCAGNDLPVMRTSLIPLTFWHGVPDPAEATRPFSEAALAELITNVVTESADLPELPSPCEAHLQMLWRALAADVQLTVACVDQHPVGLAVLSRSKGASGDLAVVEYFGIHADYRQQGVGRELLRTATNAFYSDSNSADGTLTAFVAEGNAAAQSFFIAVGFQWQSAKQLWAWRG